MFSTKKVLQFCFVNVIIVLHIKLLSSLFSQTKMTFVYINWLLGELLFYIIYLYIFFVIINYVAAQNETPSLRYSPFILCEIVSVIVLFCLFLISRWKTSKKKKSWNYHTTWSSALLFFRQSLKASLFSRTTETPLPTILLCRMRPTHYGPKALVVGVRPKMHCTPAASVPAPPC